MAFVNPNKPAGLSPVKYLNGAKWTGQANMYAVAAADTNGYWVGDLVTLASSGDLTTGLPGFTLATAGNVAVGVIVAIGTGGVGQGGGAGGPIINPNDLSVIHRPAAAQATAWYALVSDDPNLIYEIQEGGSGTNLTAAIIGENADIVYAAPATGVAVSGTTLNNGAIDTTSTRNLKVLSFAQRVDNHFVTSPATGGGAQKWWVMINNHNYRNGITGV